jgi:hypothetical protein
VVGRRKEEKESRKKGIGGVWKGGGGEIEGDAVRNDVRSGEARRRERDTN